MECSICFVILRRECVLKGGSYVMCIYATNPYHTLHTREELDGKSNVGYFIEIVYYAKSNEV